MNSNIKKIFSYLAISMLSAGLTLGAYKVFVEENQTQILTKESISEKDGSIVKTVSYEGGGLALFSQGSVDFTQAAEKTVHAVVSVKKYSGQSNNTYFDPFEFFFGQKGGQNQEPQSNELQKSGLGSGVIISSDGYIVTNNHVIEQAEKIEVTLNDQRTYEAKLVGSDTMTDIALLKIEEKGLPYLPFTNSDQLKVGQWVLAVGNPYSLNSTVTAGIISAIGRSLNLNPVESFIQTDAAINPGNSGGALVNTNGDLVGINSAISSRTGSYIGYGFAVPTNMVKKIVEDIKTYGFVQRGFLGISTVDLYNEDYLTYYNSRSGTNYKVRKGLLVEGLSEDGAAISSGIQKGDILVKVDEQELTDFASLTGYLNAKRPGDKVKVEVEREGKIKTYEITLLDQYGKSTIRSKSDLTATEVLGITVEEAPEKIKTRLGIDYGLQVVKMENGKIRQAKGLSEGCILLSINHKELKKPKDIDNILKGYKGEVSLIYIDKYGRKVYDGFELD